MRGGCKCEQAQKYTKQVMFVVLGAPCFLTVCLELAGTSTPTTGLEAFAACQPSHSPNIVYLSHAPTACSKMC
jgi:hypothetical protein